MWDVTKEELGFGNDQSLEEIEAKLTDESSPYLAGDNIYIDAVNINVGGLIQSGYGGYGVKLTENDQKKSRSDQVGLGVRNERPAERCGRDERRRLSRQRGRRGME